MIDVALKRRTTYTLVLSSPIGRETKKGSQRRHCRDSCSQQRGSSRGRTYRSTRNHLRLYVKLAFGALSDVPRIVLSITLLARRALKHTSLFIKTLMHMTTGFYVRPTFSTPIMPTISAWLKPCYLENQEQSLPWYISRWQKILLFQV